MPIRVEQANPVMIEPMDNTIFPFLDEQVVDGIGGFIRGPSDAAADRLKWL
ncbi:hypothetical protein [Pseudomonas protegens]|uniref:hypothetical protein n=1 Tax=Pseudomonas protegens TaxID=380021 RepID=UPI00383B4220